MYTRNSEIEKEFDALLELVAGIISAQSGQPATDSKKWKLGIHALSLKLFKHICSARTLLEPNAFSTPVLPAFGYIDHGTISAVTRSVLENYLVMNWLEGNGSEEKRHFRSLVWEYAGWKKRSKLFANGEEAVASKMEAAADAAQLLHLIKASPLIEQYEGRRKDSILKGKWDVSWNDLAAEAGFHLTYFTCFYRHLSGYVHSDFISALQVLQAQKVQDQYDLGLASVQSCMLVMGHFVSFYSQVFPAASAVLPGFPEAVVLAKKWHVKAEDMNFLYEDDR